MIQMDVTILNGDKEMTIDIHDSKIHCRPHFFMLLSHFFVEGLPKYSLDDKDLPNQDRENEEDQPKMNVEVFLKNSLFCLDDEKKAIASLCDINVIFDRQNALRVKESLKGHDFKSPVESSDLLNSLKFNIVDFNPFFCSYKDLDNFSDFKHIKKRELI